MSLTDFFRINLPYGMKKNSLNEWFVFNREYLPLGCNHTYLSESSYEKLPLYTAYKELTEAAILKIIKNPERVQRNQQGEIERVFFYNDATNPHANPKCWDQYFQMIKEFSKFETKNSPK